MMWFVELMSCMLNCLMCFVKLMSCMLNCLIFDLCLVLIWGKVWICVLS